MEKFYYPDHDERYAHLPKRERWKYPDEIKIGFFRIKRVKKRKDLTVEDMKRAGSVPWLLLAKDVPYTEALHDG